MSNKNGTAVPAVHDIPKNIEGFLGLMNHKPNRSAIKTNKFANNAQYLPIEYYEMKLDEIFLGLWRSRCIGEGARVMGNAIIYDIEVDFFHPIYKQWLTRAGTGAVEIQLDAETKLVKGKALQKNAPAAKAEAFKNACKSIGRLFGRDLNRKDSKDFTFIYGQALNE